MAFGSFDNKSSNHTMSEINMVPLIDVMLVLLVIFIITAPLLSHSIKINMPQASAEPVVEDPTTIDLAIDDLGQVYWNEQAVSMEELAGRFSLEARAEPQPELRIRADRDTRYETLAQVMGYAKTSGLKRVGFITRPSETAASSSEAPAAQQPQVSPASQEP